MPVDINQKLRELENQIRTAYNSASIIDNVCTPTAVPPETRPNTFRQFVNSWLIERQHILDESHHLILGDLGEEVARNEIREIINRIGNSCKPRTVQDLTITEIRTSVQQLQSHGFRPNRIFLPIEYFHEVIEWNHSSERTIAQYGGQYGSVTDSIYIDSSMILKVIYSNKYIPLDRVIITSKEANKWEFRPDAETNGRLTAKFNWDMNDPVNTSLLVRTVFNLVITDTRGNTVLQMVNRRNSD